MSDQAYHHSNNCVYALRYHMVLVVRYRRKVLTAPMLDTARASIEERCASHGGALLEFGAEADHLHLLISLPPQVAVADFANAVKTNVSRRLRRDFPQLLDLGGALWSPSYFVATCGGAPLETIKTYIRSQERPA